MCTYLYIIMAYNDIEPPTHEEWKAKGTERERKHNILFSKQKMGFVGYCDQNANKRYWGRFCVIKVLMSLLFEPY